MSKQDEMEARLSGELADARAALALAEADVASLTESLAAAEEENARLRRSVERLTGEVELHAQVKHWQGIAEKMKGPKES